VPFLGEAGFPPNTMSAGLRTKWNLNPSSRLATIDMGQKVGWAAVQLFVRGELGPHLTQCRLGRGLLKCQVSSSSVQPFGHNTPTLQTDRQDRTDNGLIA